MLNLITRELEKRPLFAVFDRDGTLVPITDDPLAAMVSAELKANLRKLAGTKNTKVAVLSARGLRHLSQDFCGDGLILAGNYGLEILLPDKRAFIQPKAKASREMLSKARLRFQSELPKDVNIILEDHELSLCLHWHRTPPARREEVHASARRLKKEMPELSFRALPTSYEVLPDVLWTKADGMAQIASMCQINGTEPLYVYAGDSEYDEPAFRWVNERQGISVKIGKAEQTEAQFCLDSPASLAGLIEKLIHLRVLS